MLKSTQKPGKRVPSALSGGRSLDKLAQHGTSSFSRGASGAAGAVAEDDLKLTKTAKFSAKENFGKRARVKFLTEAMAVGLANVPGSQLTKSYWNTYYCSSVLQKKGDALTGKYCKNRWCLVCCRIRSAQLIKQYTSVLESWPEKHLVTLTVPNCSAVDLEATTVAMKAGFNTIRDTWAKQHRRGQRSAPLVALRKLEATHNPTRDDYHPHFHLVVPNLATANELRASWLTQFPAAKWDGQDVRPANGGAAHELFKYFTKLVTTKSNERFIRLAPLNIIFEAIAGGRTFQAFGIKAPKVSEDLDEEAAALADELNIDAVFEWVQEQADWIDKESGEMLTNYKPTPQFRKFVESKIVYNSPQKNPKISDGSK